MKISPQDFELNVNLGPSNFSASGFMDSCGITIDDLINSDKRKMQDLGVSPTDIALGLESIYAKAEHQFGAEVEIRSGLFASFFESRGKIPSPFKGHGLFEKGETVLVDRVTERKLIITKLGIAMIKTYSFFQAPGSRYRIDPEVAVNIFNIA